MNYERSIRGDEPLALPDATGDAARRRRRTVIGAAAAAIVVLLLAWYAFAGGKPAAKPPAQVAPSVTFVVPGRQNVDRAITATGSLAAKRDMPVGVAGEGGAVRQVLVEPGQWVAAGQVLAIVDRSVQSQTAAGLAAQVAVAESDRAIAQSELDRAQALVDHGFISKADLQRKAATRDAAAARVKVAQAQLAQQRASNGRLDIRSPAAGLVLTRSLEAGQVVGPGSGTLFRIAEKGELEMRAAVAESDLAALRPGARATVTPVGSSQGFAGTVWQVSPIVDPTTRQGIARVALAYDPALRPGGFATVRIVAGGSLVPRLPESAVQSDDKGNYVYIIDRANKVVRRAVTTGPVGDGGVAIASGLAGDERVVQSAAAFLNPGQTVTPVRAGAQGS